MDELQQELFKLQDLKYRNFHSKLMPGIDKETIIGIRTESPDESSSGGRSFFAGAATYLL